MAPVLAALPRVHSVSTVVAGTCKGSGSAESTTNSELHSSAPVAVQTGVLFAQLGSRGDHMCGVHVKTGVGYRWGEQLRWPGRRRHDHVTPPDAHASGRSAVGQARRHACRGVPTMFREPFLGLPLPLDSSVCRS